MDFSSVEERTIKSFSFRHFYAGFFTISFPGLRTFLCLQYFFFLFLVTIVCLQALAQLARGKIILHGTADRENGKEMGFFSPQTNKREVRSHQRDNFKGKVLSKSFISSISLPMARSFVKPCRVTRRASLFRSDHHSAQVT